MKKTTSAKYQKTHENLKIQALKLFLDKGYEATSIQEITQKAGLSVGAFYRHFDSKEGIFVEIWDEYTGANIEKTLIEVEKRDSVEAAMDYLLQECESFSNDETTNKLYAIYASLAVSQRLDAFPHMEQSSRKYRQVLHRLIQEYNPDIEEMDAVTRANALHCLMNTYSTRNGETFQAFCFDKEAFRKCVFALLSL